MTVCSVRAQQIDSATHHALGLGLAGGVTLQGSIIWGHNRLEPGLSLDLLHDDYSDGLRYSRTSPTLSLGFYHNRKLDEDFTFYVGPQLRLGVDVHTYSIEHARFYLTPGFYIKLGTEFAIIPELTIAGEISAGVTVTNPPFTIPSTWYEGKAEQWVYDISTTTGMVVRYYF